MYVYLLVGLPAAGKSTFRKHLTRMHPLKGWVIVSSDDYIDHKAKQLNKTYSEIYLEYRDEANTFAMKRFEGAIASRRAVIIDKTNLTKQERKAFLSKIPRDYRVTCVIVKAPSEAEHQRRLRERPGKYIPEDVLLEMRAKFENPEPDEGFHSVYEWPQECVNEKEEVID